MTKKKIVNQIAKRAKETQQKTKKIVQWTFEAIIETLLKEGRIELRNFGVFEVKRRKARRARNPRTNKPVMVDAKNVLTFQPGKLVEKKILDARVHVPKKKKAAKKPARKTAKGKNTPTTPEIAPMPEASTPPSELT